MASKRKINGEKTTWINVSFVLARFLARPLENNLRGPWGRYFISVHYRNHIWSTYPALVIQNGRSGLTLFASLSPAYNSCPIKYQISKNEITFLDTTVFKGERFTKKSILDIKTHYKPTETFLYIHFTSCHPSGVKRGFIKGEAIRLRRTNSSTTTFDECLANFKQRLEARGYPKQDIERSLTEVNYRR